MVRKMKPGRLKETKKDKLEKRKDMVEIYNKMYTVVIPVLATIALGIVALIWFKTRVPSTINPEF